MIGGEKIDAGKVTKSGEKRMVVIVNALRRWETKELCQLRVEDAAFRRDEIISDLKRKGLFVFTISADMVGGFEGVDQLRLQA